MADADRSVHRVVNALLANMGVEIHSARTGPEAIAMTRDQAYDLLLLDPALTGSTEPLVPSLLGQHPELASRLVLLGGDDGRLDPGLADVPRLPKPLVPRDARAVLQRMLRRPGP